MNKNIVFLSLLFIVCFLFTPFFVESVDPIVWVQVELDEIFGFRNGSIGVSVCSNALDVRVKIYDPYDVLIYNELWDSNSSRSLPISSSADYGTYTVVGIVNENINVVLFTVVDVSNWVTPSFPHVVEHKGLSYSFNKNWSVIISNSFNDSLMLDFSLFEHLVMWFNLQVIPKYNDMNFLVRFKREDLGILLDLNFMFIHKGCKVLINGTMDQSRIFSFDFGKSKLHKLLDSFKSGNIIFDFSDFRKVKQHCEYDSVNKVLWVEVPKTFILDPYIFSDGFESGDESEWDGEDPTVEVVSTTSHHGTYSMEADGSAGAEYLYKSVSSLDDAYVRAYINLTAIASTTNQEIEFFYFRGGGFSYFTVGNR